MASRLMLGGCMDVNLQARVGGGDKGAAHCADRGQIGGATLVVGSGAAINTNVVAGAVEVIETNIGVAGIDGRGTGDESIPTLSKNRTPGYDSLVIITTAIIACFKEIIRHLWAIIKRAMDKTDVTCNITAR